MKAAARALIALTAAACLAALAVSVWPGVLNDLLVPAVLLSFVVVPVVGLGAVVVLVLLARKGRLRAARVPWTEAAVVLALLCGTYVLLKLYVPRRIAFAVSRGAFEELVPEAPPAHGGGTALHRRVGVYEVDEYAADPRGGVYFRVHRGQDLPGPDSMSYGFVHRPNPEGTPFGSAKYRVFRLGGDWSWFRASDDW